MESSCQDLSLQKSQNNSKGSLAKGSDRNWHVLFFSFLHWIQRCGYKAWPLLVLELLASRLAACSASLEKPQPLEVSEGRARGNIRRHGMALHCLVYIHPLKASQVWKHCCARGEEKEVNITLSKSSSNTVVRAIYIKLTVSGEARCQGLVSFQDTFLLPNF